MIVVVSLLAVSRAVFAYGIEPLFLQCNKTKSIQKFPSIEDQPLLPNEMVELKNTVVELTNTITEMKKRLDRGGIWRKVGSFCCKFFSTPSFILCRLSNKLLNWVLDFYFFKTIIIEIFDCGTRNKNFILNENFSNKKRSNKAKNFLKKLFLQHNF